MGDLGHRQPIHLAPQPRSLSQSNQPLTQPYKALLLFSAQVPGATLVRLSPRVHRTWLWGWKPALLGFPPTVPASTCSCQFVLIFPGKPPPAPTSHSQSAAGQPLQTAHRDALLCRLPHLSSLPPRNIPYRNRKHFHPLGSCPHTLQGPAQPQAAPADPPRPRLLPHTSHFSHLH